METKESKSNRITLEIFRVILEQSNGYSKKEIINCKLAEDCEGSEYWEAIYNKIFDNI